MCGGISAALGIATARGADGRPRPLLLVGYQLGRAGSYALAGLVLGGALAGAATMAAFGIGTLPSMFLAAFGAQRLAGFSARPAARRVAGWALVASAALTLAGPWLPHPAWLHERLPFVCAAA